MFLFFCFPGLTQVYLDHSPWFMYKCACLWYTSFVLSGQRLIICVYSARLRVGVPDSPFCHIMRMLIICCHGEVMWQDLGVSGTPQILLIFVWHVWLSIFWLLDTANIKLLPIPVFKLLLKWHSCCGIDSPKSTMKSRYVQGGGWPYCLTTDQKLTTSW